MCLNTAHVSIGHGLWSNTLWKVPETKTLILIWRQAFSQASLTPPPTVRVSETSKSRAVARMGPWHRAPPVWWRLKKIKFRNYLSLWNSILWPWWKVQITVVPSHLKLFPAINFNSYEHSVKRRISVSCRMSVYSSAEKIRSRQAS